MRRILASLRVEDARPRDGVVLALLALAIRIVVVVWAAPHFPPADDGTFYHTVATRIAQGQGYTWLWPDGAITYAAHYPVGYPALIAVGYALFGAAPAVAMVVNALVGAASVWAVHDLAGRIGARLGALMAGGAVAFHPGLVLYTPALMTEAVAAGLLVIGAAFACRLAAAESIRYLPLAALGLLAGAFVLLRPQTLLFVPALGFVAAAAPGRAEWGRRLRGALAVSALGVFCCLPWTIRNCTRMDQCAFVSANGGWNLLIGSLPSEHGGFVPIEGATVPSECREVFAEVGKDRCFGRAGLRRIREAPLEWLSKVPSKLGTTFDYIGAAAHYLHASNPKAFAYDHKLALGAVETIWHRLTLLAALVALGRAEGPRRRPRLVLMALSTPWLFLHAGWVAHLGLVVCGALLGSRLLRLGPVLLAIWLLTVTAVTHAVFFGAGRYALVVVPLLSALIGGVGGRESAREHPGFPPS